MQELRQIDNPFYAMHFVDTGGVERYGYYGAYAKNPFWDAKHFDNRVKTDNIIGDVKFGYKHGEVNVYDRLGANIGADRSTYQSPVLLVMPVDPFYAGNEYQLQGGLTQTNSNSFHLYNDLIGTFTHQLSNNFGMNVLLGHNVTVTNDESLWAQIDPKSNGLVIPGFYNFTNNQGPIYVDNPISKQRNFGIYGDVTFNFQRELYLNLTARNDWNSTLMHHENSYFYPGANASWVFTERLRGGGFKDKFLNYGKIRAGVSGVGNGAVPYATNDPGFKQLPIKTGFGSIVPPFNSVPAFQIGNTLGFESLRPEITHTFEVGTDLSMLKDRISLSFTYYSSITKNLITPVNMAPSSGFLFRYANIGDITNRGEEIALRGTPISTKYGLRWDVFATYTHNESNVQSLTGGLDHVVLGGYSGMAIVAAVGHPYGTFYAADIQYWNGHAVVDAKTGLPIATTKPVYKGSYQPDFIASWGTNLSYKGLTLHLLFTTKQGGQFYSQNKMNLDFNGTSSETITNNRNPYVWKNSVNQVGTTNTYVTNTTKFSPMIIIPTWKVPICRHRGFWAQAM